MSSANVSFESMRRLFQIPLLRRFDRREKLLPHIAGELVKRIHCENDAEQLFPSTLGKIRVGSGYRVYRRTGFPSVFDVLSSRVASSSRTLGKSRERRCPALEPVAPVRNWETAAPILQ